MCSHTNDIYREPIREQVYKPVIKEIEELITTQIRQVEEGYQKPPKVRLSINVIYSTNVPVRLHGGRLWEVQVLVRMPQ